MKSLTITGIVTLVILGLGRGLGTLSAAQQPRHLVRHAQDGGGMLPDHTQEIKTQLLAAFNDNGILEFEAGKIYRTTEIRVWKNGSGLSGTLSTERKMPAAIEGNGATLKWVQGDSPPAGASLLYLWDPQEYGNDGFYVRNLTLDCGNNENGKLKNQGINGELPDGAEACTYGLRIWGGKNFLVENVTVMRGEQAGVLVQTSTGYEVRNVMFRNVMSRFGDKRGWWFSATKTGPIEVKWSWKTVMPASIWRKGFMSMTPKTF